MKRVLFAVVSLLLIGIIIVPAHAANSCHRINAKAVGRDLGGGAIAGRTIGGGLLHGTIAGNIVPTGLAGTVASFFETVTFTTNRATLTVEVTGAIDVTTGEFNASGQVTEATGKLEGATGTMSFSGAVDFGTATFTEDVSGFVCVDLAP